MKMVEKFRKAGIKTLVIISTIRIVITRGWARCSAAGFNTYQTPIGEFSLGGLELIDISADKVKILHQIPITKYLSDGIVLSHNPFWAEVLNGKLKLYFMPERNGHADLHTFDIELVN